MPASPNNSSGRTNTNRGNSRPSTRRVAGARRQQQAAATPAVAPPQARTGGAAPPEELAPPDSGPATEEKDATITEPATAEKTTTEKAKPGPGPLPRPRITRSANTTATKKTNRTAAKTRTEESAETRSRTRLSRLWFATAALLAIAVASGVLATNWLGSYRDAQAREQAWERALPAAKENVARLFSYDYRHIQADRNAVANLLTGQFRTDYLSSMDKLVIPQAPAKRFVLVSTTQSAGVSSVTQDGHQAVVIVFLNQSITNTDVKARTDLVRLRVTMTEVGGRWLISEVKSV